MLETVASSMDMVHVWGIGRSWDVLNGFLWQSFDRVLLGALSRIDRADHGVASGAFLLESSFLSLTISTLFTLKVRV